MSVVEEKKFSFYSGSGNGQEYFVVRFTGRGALSTPYRFEITLLSKDADTDPEQLVNKPARFVLHRDGEDVTWHGIVMDAEYLRSFQGYSLFTAILTPRLEWLKNTHHNQIFLHEDVRQMLTDVLKDVRFTPDQFDFRLQQKHPGHSYVCQYGESHFNFINRWCEREGIYYYFDQTDAGEKVIFTDTHVAHVAAAQGKKVVYSPVSGLDSGHRDEVVQAFTHRRRLVSSKVVLRDYNYEKPTIPMIGEADVDTSGRGELTSYGEYFLSPEEGTRLAKIRAEEQGCRKETFEGESTVPWLQPGFVFEMTGHYRNKLNRRFLTIGIEMEGDQTAAFVSGLKTELAEREKQVVYRNRFTAIPADVQFRPEVKTPKARINGTIQAWIDSAGSGKYAELDDQGRYRVIMPFDRSGRKDGKASTWLRRVQPYGGQGHGMHMPLHKGSEVVIAFTNGDPDRPIIAGSAPNPQTPSVITADNQTRSHLNSASGNDIHFEDKQGEERMQFHSRKGGEFMRIGAPNDPPYPGTYQDPEASRAQTEAYAAIADWFFNLHKNWTFAPDLKRHGITLGAGAKLEIEAATKNSVAMIEKLTLIVGMEEKINTPIMLRFLGGREDHLECTSHTDMKWTHTDMNSLHDRLNGLKTNLAVTEETISESRTTLNGIDNTVSETDERLQASRTLVAGEHAKIQQSQEKAEGVREKLHAMKTSISQTLQKVSTTAQNISTIKEEVREMHQQVGANKTEASTLVSEMAEMKQSMGALQQRASALYSQAAELALED